jgi:hypothetical protein
VGILARYAAEPRSLDSFALVVTASANWRFMRASWRFGLGVQLVAFSAASFAALFRSAFWSERPLQLLLPLMLR